MDFGFVGKRPVLRLRVPHGNGRGEQNRLNLPWDHHETTKFAKEERSSLRGFHVRFPELQVFVVKRVLLWNPVLKKTGREDGLRPNRAVSPSLE